MRPVHLHAEGFAAFRDPIDVDFDDCDLFALVGPTGSGKSSVIDAICFALYGCIPRLDQRAVAPVITLGASQATVSLTFEVAGQRYVVTRAARRGRDGRATTREARLERCLDGGSTEVLAGSVRELDPAVARIVGLPFEHFTRCVVLPQGEFARFLHDEPKKRQDLLRDLLGLGVYRRVGELARDRSAARGAEAERLDRDLADLSFATAEAKASAAQRVQALRALQKAVQRHEPADEQFGKRIAEAESTAQRARDLAGFLGAVEVPEAATDLAGRLDAEQAKRRAAADGVVAAEAAVTEAEEQVGRLPGKAELELARQAHGDLAQVDVQRAAAAAAVESAREADGSAGEALRQAEERAGAAGEALEAARHAHAAHALAATLTAGAPCPVCEQPVARVPRRAAPAALRTAEQAAAKAQAAVERARGQKGATERELAAAQTALGGLEERRSDLAARVERHPDPSALETFLSQVAEAEGALAAARERERGARAKEKQAQGTLERLQEDERRLSAVFGKQRDPVVALGPPDRTGAGLAADWQRLAEWAGEQRAVQEQQAAEAAGRAEQAREARNAALDDLAARSRDLGVPLPGARRAPGLATLREAVAECASGAEHEHRRINDAIEKAEKLRAEAEAARGEAAVAKLLGNLLKADNFERWLLDSAMGTLLAAASETLHEMSGGAYSLVANDREISVVDHANADEQRPVRTLSGGETFQASLALALALAQHIASLAAEGASKLEAIFLDEGFGTLDAETLDTVAGTIERLGSDGRMVGLVTHVPALADRVPVRFRVAKGTRTSTVVREEG